MLNIAKTVRRLLNNRQIDFTVDNTDTGYYFGDADNGMPTPAGYFTGVFAYRVEDALDGDVTLTFHNQTKGTSENVVVPSTDTIGAYEFADELFFDDNDELAIEVSAHEGTGSTGTVRFKALYEAGEIPK